MTSYSSAILIHGLAIPGAMIGLSLGGSWIGLNKIQEEKDTAATLRKEYTDLTAQIDAANEKLDGRRELMSAWDENLEGEVLQKMTRSLQEIMERYNDRELRQTALGRPADRSLLAGYTENNYARFQLSFEGGFGPMQQVLAELETKFPQMVLERFTVQPGRENTFLEFNATYICWQENREDA